MGVGVVSELKPLIPVSAFSKPSFHSNLNIFRDQALLGPDDTTARKTTRKSRGPRSWISPEQKREADDAGGGT